MLREFQSVQSHAVNDYRKQVQYHVQAVSETQQNHHDNHHRKLSEHRSCHFVHRVAYRRAREGNRPQSDVRNDVAEHVDDSEQDADYVLQTFENRLSYASLVIRENEIQQKAESQNPERDCRKIMRSKESEKVHAFAVVHERERIVHAVRHDHAQNHVNLAPHLQERAEVARRIETFLPRV